jgi:glycosyltransferase involved in cell wall biosynthesis
MGEGLLLPVLTLKLLRKNIILSLASSAPKMIEAKKNIPLLSRMTKFLELINFILSDKIILYSPKLVKEWNLEKYKNKISIAHRHFLDFDKYKIKMKFDDRDNLVGYIGRLSEEKGVLNFVEAVPEILEGICEIRFLIGGDGQLRDEIEKNISKENLNDKIELTGWIPHDALPDYLNELKLVILPSYTEGLPNLMLEAMACGTPVLATLVGAIPDIIKDGETGFVMENNSPECIAENVVRALEHSNSEEIVKNARELVEKEFTYEAAVERYKKVLEEL